MNMHETIAGFRKINQDQVRELVDALHHDLGVILAEFAANSNKLTLSQMVSLKMKVDNLTAAWERAAALEQCETFDSSFNKEQ